MQLNALLWLFCALLHLECKLVGCLFCLLSKVEPLKSEETQYKHWQKEPAKLSECFDNHEKNNLVNVILEGKI